MPPEWVKSSLGPIVFLRFEFRKVLVDLFQERMERRE